MDSQLKVKLAPGIFANLNQHENALFVLLEQWVESVEAVLQGKTLFPDGVMFTCPISEIGTILLERIQELWISPDSLITNNESMLNEAIRDKSPLVAISLNEALFQE